MTKRTLSATASTLIAIISIISSACASEPSPEKLQAVLVKHPEVLYATVRAHPAEFIAVLNKAAQESQAQRQAEAARADEIRVNDEFEHPRQPDISGHVSLGPVDAPITFVEYADFECPFCRAVQPVVEAVLRKYQGKIRLVIKQTPLDIHPHAMPAALMFEAVAHQGAGRALRFYDDLYAHQDQMKIDGDRFLASAASRAGADAALASRDAQSSAARDAVARDLDEFKRFGYTGTPGFLINGVSLEGSLPESAFDRIIDRELASIALSNRTGSERRANKAAQSAGGKKQ